MLQIIPLKCPSCGARLQIAPEMEQFACGYCGGELQVIRRGGIIALRTLAAAIERVQKGTDRTALELELSRLQSEIGRLRERRTSFENELRTNNDPVMWLGAILFPFIAFVTVKWLFGPEAAIVVTLTIGLLTVWFLNYFSNESARMSALVDEVTTEVEKIEARIKVLRAELGSPHGFGA